MEDKKNILTKSSRKKLEDELQELKVVRRKEIAQKIKEAREQGDLSENAEYDAAKDEQRDIEARIEEIETILKNSEVIDRKSIDFKSVHIGCKVTVLDKATKKEMTFQIVSSTEVNSLERKISYESPIGAGLMGKKVDDEVQIETPGGILKLKVIDIAKTKDV